jgi:hypothetical protein
LTLKIKAALSFATSRTVFPTTKREHPAELESSAIPVSDSISPEDARSELFQNVRNILPIDMTSSQKYFLKDFLESRHIS